MEPLGGPGLSRGEFWFLIVVFVVAFALLATGVVS